MREARLLDLQRAGLTLKIPVWKSVINPGGPQQSLEPLQ